MKYILTQEEKDALVPKELLLLEELKVRTLVKLYKEKNGCAYEKDGYGCCDKCPIASVNINTFLVKPGIMEKAYIRVCENQNFSQ